MTAQQTARIPDIFGEAIELPAAERPAFIADACNGDTTVQREVEALLASIEDAGSFLCAPATGADGNLFGVANELVAKLEAPGTQIDRYKLLDLIGEGGFGSVFKAEQNYPVRRTVALKIIKLGMDTKQVIARFEAERQALAMMDHPNIARVFDAGATDTGRPYFVMELVQGVPITSYCDSGKLRAAERLALFAEVCHAVQHAHQKGIIHRDLKPSNVLVTMHDDKPVPKVIDFGIAKATHGRLTDRSMQTDLGHFIGTPQYMSPEQAQFSGIDIDTRSDVYSLGVLLYELLTGTTPFAAKELRSASASDIGNIIGNILPPRPSTRLGKLGEELPAVAARRGTDPKRLAQQMRGELDWVVMKCLEKDRTRRYDAVSALAADIKRYLADEPVLARPTSGSYRLRKFASRHKAAVTAVSVALIGLIGGLVAASYGLVRATNERDAAVIVRKQEAAQRKIAESVNQFLASILESARPDLALGKTPLVRDVLDQAATKIDNGDLKDQPEIEVSVRQTIGRSYFELGEYHAAESQFRKAIAVAQRSAGPVSPLVGFLLVELSSAVGWGGNREQGIAIAREALAMQRRVHGDTSVYTASAMETVAVDLSNTGQNKEAQSLVRGAIGIRRKLGERENRFLAFDLGLAATTLQGNLAEKEKLLRAGLAMQRNLLPANHPDIANTLHNLGVVLNAEGDLAQAKVVLEEALAIKQKVLPPNHPDLESTLNMLAGVLEQLKDWPALEPVLLARYSYSTQRSHASAPISQIEQIARNYEQMGKPELAKSWHQKATEARLVATQPDKASQ